MKTKFIIFASQDYDKANHKGLWDKLSQIPGNDVIVVNIPADQIIARIKHPERIDDAKYGVKKITESLRVIRPMVDLRPEFVPKFFYKSYARHLWKQIEKQVPDIRECHLNVIIYNAFWVEILKNSRIDMTIAYYLFDEVRRNGKDNTVNKKRYTQDEFACKNSDVIFTMTKMLAESRREYNDHIIVLGNGADVPNIKGNIEKIKNSAAFVGNFRDWIDKEMLETVIAAMPETNFAFVGSIEANMKDFFDHITSIYLNTKYYGRVDKDKINELYTMFDCIIIPYLNNKFIRATRPIKIVEAVLAGTPVVTVPMDGYNECEFVRFAQSAEDFVKEIRYCQEHSIDYGSSKYIQFVNENTWEAKAKCICTTIDNL